MMVSSAWRTLRAFARKDLRVAASYRTDFLVRNFGILVFTLLFFFLSQTVSSPESLLEGQDLEYFPFVVVGLAFYSFLNTLVNDFPETIRQAQTYGVLEPMIITATPIPVILVGTLAFPLLRSTFSVLTYLVLALILGVDFSQANLLGAIAMLGATLLAFSGLGALLAALVMIFRQNFSRFLLQTVFVLFGGVFFPIDVLPAGFRWLAYLVPLTPALNGMRAALLQGASFGELSQPLGSLMLFALVLLPLGLLCFRTAVRVAQRDGTLTYR